MSDVRIVFEDEDAYEHHLAEVKAEALEEAAEDAEIAWLDDMVPEKVKQTDLIAWLRRRAARLRREQP